MKVSAVLASKGNRTFTIEPGALVEAAVATLAANNIGAVIVVAGGGLPTGMLSERDIIRKLASDPSTLERTVAEVMTFPVICGAPGDDLESVLRTMTAERFRHLPVVEGGEIVGMVTIGDLVKAQLAELRGVAANLETQLLES